MAPILGIWASQISGHLFQPSGAYDSIATVTVGAGGSTSIDFSSIPQTYTHLQLRYFARNNSGFGEQGIRVFYNNDTTVSNYYAHRLQGDGSSAGAWSDPQPAIGTIYGGGSAYFSAGVIDILDYANTNKKKTARSLSGTDANGSGYVALYSDLWNASSNAINQLTISQAGNTFQQYSQFALYGIKGN